MSSLSRPMSILGLIVIGALALFFMVVLAGQVVVVAAGAGDASRGLGGLLGTLFAALVCIAVFLRILRRLRAG